MNQKPRLYDQIVVITAEYLGPAAERFLYRQVTNHLGIPPTALNKRDLEKLLTWIRLAMIILTNDEQLVSEYMEQLRDVIRNDKKLTHL
jgi:hypothetical protein